MKWAEKQWHPKMNPDHYLDRMETAAKRIDQNKRIREFTEQMDLSAQDNHMKYERPQFAVVTATEAYRRGYDQMMQEYVCAECDVGFYGWRERTEPPECCECGKPMVPAND